jgi:hypothetical protein
VNVEVANGLQQSWTFDVRRSTFDVKPLSHRRVVNRPLPPTLLWHRPISC